MILPCKIIFANESVKKSFEELSSSTTEDKNLFDSLELAFTEISKNAFCGIQISKKQIPEEYFRKYSIDNLWKYNLPHAWRLLYSIARDEVTVIGIILEWSNHKNYERRFGYSKK
jgi:hypothetical protein